jgi:hypothetical protein
MQVQAVSLRAARMAERGVRTRHGVLDRDPAVVHARTVRVLDVTEG